MHPIKNKSLYLKAVCLHMCGLHNGIILRYDRSVTYTVLPLLNFLIKDNFSPNKV